MEALFEILLEIVFEIFGQLIFEPIGRRLAPFLDRKSARYSRAIALLIKVPAYAACGFLIGLISIAVYPHHVTDAPRMRLIALFAGPIVAGAVMSAIGRWLERHGKRRTDFERFFYGFGFAFAYSLTRWAWAD